MRGLPNRYHPRCCSAVNSMVGGRPVPIAQHNSFALGTRAALVVLSDGAHAYDLTASVDPIGTAGLFVRAHADVIPPYIIAVTPPLCRLRRCSGCMRIGRSWCRHCCS